MLHFVGILSSRFAHDARSQEHKDCSTFNVLTNVFSGNIYKPVTEGLAVKIFKILKPSTLSTYASCKTDALTN